MRHSPHLFPPCEKMKATEFEFRHRAFLNLAHVWLAFQMYAFDHANVVSYFFPWNSPRGAVLARSVLVCAAMLVGAAAAIRTWATAYLGSEVVFDLSLHTNRLVADGPYRYVRNPLYLGTLLLSFGLGFLANRIGFLILIAGAILRILRLIGREESELSQQHPTQFARFADAVPRLLPSVFPRIPPAGLVPRWGQAFRAEAFMWGFFATMMAFAITLRIRVGWTLGFLTFTLWVVQRASNQWTQAKKDTR
jgi:protein-S-isoprenylcysteine O-methyltransferase Ste14